MWFAKSRGYIDGEVVSGRGCVDKRREDKQAGKGARIDGELRCSRERADGEMRIAGREKEENTRPGWEFTTSVNSGLARTLGSDTLCSHHLRRWLLSSSHRCILSVVTIPAALL